MDTSNIMVKKQLFDLLAALSVFSADGHRLALDALEHYKVTDERDQFKIISDQPWRRIDLQHIDPKCVNSTL